MPWCNLQPTTCVPVDLVSGRQWLVLLLKIAKAGYEPRILFGFRSLSHTSRAFGYSAIAPLPTDLLFFSKQALSLLELRT